MQEEQQKQCVSELRRFRRGQKNHIEEGNSVHNGETESRRQEWEKTTRGKKGDRKHECLECGKIYSHRPLCPASVTHQDGGVTRIVEFTLN